MACIVEFRGEDSGDGCGGGDGCAAAVHGLAESCIDGLAASASAHHGHGAGPLCARASGGCCPRRDTQLTPAQPCARTVPVDRQYPNLERVHASPDIYVIKDFLTEHECTALQEEAERRGLSQSPVKYGGWTQDVGELLRLLAVGPAVWIALVPELSSQGKPTAQVAIEVVGTWLGTVALFGVLLLGWAKWRELNLQALRTSTSVRLDASVGSVHAYEEKARRLLTLPSATTFEGVDIIRYEPGQALRPHYDANREAAVEDAGRGGQGLATALGYLNHCAVGGRTRFGKLDLEVEPKRGECLLFFPADRHGVFDERTEHEGTEAVDEKWLARIWVHQSPVPTRGDPGQTARPAGA